MSIEVWRLKYKIHVWQHVGAESSTDVVIKLEKLKRSQKWAAFTLMLMGAGSQTKERYNTVPILFSATPLNVPR